MSQRGQEREAQRAAEANRVRALDEAANESDLVLDIGAAEHRYQGTRRALHHRGERVDLALQEPPGRSGQPMRDGLGAGPSPVGGGERIVDVNVGELRQRRAQPGVVAHLPGLEPHVLEHQHLSRQQPFGQLTRL